jgi:cystathionine gamma-synthase
VKLETLSIHVGRDIEPTGDVAPAIHLSTTFERDLDGSFTHGYSYARAGNPTRKALEQCIAALEGGSNALTFSSGSAASMAVFGLLRPGDHVIVPIESYHGTAKQVRDLLAPLGVQHSFVDMTDIGAVRSAINPRTKLIWIETPSNPMLNLSDIETIAQLAHGHGALVCCDNTFATPICQRPFELGCDLVMHSSTKFFGGHSDVMGGAVVVRESGAVLDRLREYQETAGGVPSPFDCWLIRRSLTTLGCRVRAQSESALALARFLEQQPGIERVFYPGLSTHPAHALAQRQMRGGFGAMLSFCVKGGRADAFAVANTLKYFTRATSLGGVESLIEHRASVEGPHSITPDNLLRVSVGLEHVEDLREDLERALARAN